MELMEIAQLYSLTLASLVGLALLMFIQVIVADAVSIKVKHTPGYPIKADHNSFLFRAYRAQANTSETALIYVICALLCVALSLNPSYTNGFSALYIAGRLCHMLCYYLDLRVLRSVSFAISMLGIACMLGTIVWALVA